MESQRFSAEPFKGDPRQPADVELARASELRIRRVIDQNGELAGDLPDPDLPKELLRAMYEKMMLVRAIDERGRILQRSGRIMFWISQTGQEACQVGPTYAMQNSDWIFRAHRELAPWLVRGAPLELLFAQFFGAEGEPLRGRRLPCLIGNRKINLVASVTPVGAFIAHANGAAWAAKIMGSDVKVLSFFGDGGTSRGEFHSAMNFAGIHRPPIIFICVNNSWAVSTPLDQQTAMTDFAAKGNAYGVSNMRVDGNDVLAMYAATKKARDNLGSLGPILLEAVTYRLGFHTSSDNPDLYRKQLECERWAPWDPIRRMRLYLQHRNWWSEQDERDLVASHKDQIQHAVACAETMDLPDAASQFDSIYEQLDWILSEQRSELLADLGAPGGK
jgi:pyruvate dehydrogenase E1 component alpha subunit